MDKKFIKVLIEEGRPLHELKPEEALTRLNNEIMTVYVMNGLHRSMQPEAFREEVRTCAVAMYNEFVNDPLYKTVRDKEISYIFSNGMKGRLNTDKDIGLSYKNLIRWVEGYVNHPERKEALRMWFDEHRPKPPQLPPHVTTKEDYIRMVNEAWADYREYKLNEESRQEAIKKGAYKKSRQPKAIGEVLGFPITCNDYGKVRIGYLISIGEAKEGDCLADVFGQSWNSGYRGKLFVTKK